MRMLVVQLWVFKYDRDQRYRKKKQLRKLKILHLWHNLRQFHQTIVRFDCMQVIYELNQSDWWLHLINLANHLIFFFKYKSTFYQYQINYFARWNWIFKLGAYTRVAKQKLIVEIDIRNCGVWNSTNLMNRITFFNLPTFKMPFGSFKLRLELSKFTWESLREIYLKFFLNVNWISD